MRLSLSSERKLFLPFVIAAVACLTLASIVSAYTVAAQANEPPEFVEPKLEVSITEDTSIGTEIATYTVTDPEDDEISYSMLDSGDAESFQISDTGALTTLVQFDYETQTPCLTCRVAIVASDGTSNILANVVIHVTNINDEPPEFGLIDRDIAIPENVSIGAVVGRYAATDPDGDELQYSLSGRDAGAFQISDMGILTTRVHFDYDTQTPCLICVVTIAVSDGIHLRVIDVAIHVNDVDDFTPTLDVSKANPVFGRQQGDPEHALDDSPEKYVEAVSANWNTILRIEVTREFPDPNCGSGNDCVILSVESDNTNSEQELVAMRSATQGELFVTAVKLVESEAAGGETATITGGDGTERSIDLIEVAEEDIVRISFDQLRVSISVENEPPTFADFDYTHRQVDGDEEELEFEFVFEVKDSGSGIPQPEDLPDEDGDRNYMPVVALVHDSQCYDSPQSGESLEVVNNLMLHIGAIYCDGQPEVRPITDDRDFYEIDGPGYELRTTIVLPAETPSYLTFIACDHAGNCTAYDQFRGNDAVLLKVPSDDRMPSDPCLETIADDKITIRSAVHAACNSTNKAGSYARYYTFTLDDRADVTINLTSKEDTYLFLLEGAGRDGRLVAQNDDIVPGSNRNSRIEATLDAGEYTIEATTYKPATTGDFTLSLEVLDRAQPPAPGTGFIDVSRGFDHACALHSDGSIACWGENDVGQATPPSSGSFTAISSDYKGTCALRDDGAVLCWGSFVVPAP